MSSPAEQGDSVRLAKHCEIRLEEHGPAYFHSPNQLSTARISKSSTGWRVAVAIC